MRRRSAYFKFLILMAAIAACAANLPGRLATAQKAVTSIIFRELSEPAGLKFRHYNGMTGKFFLPEIMGGGAALFDFDNDGDLEQYASALSLLEKSHAAYPQKTDTAATLAYLLATSAQYEQRSGARALALAQNIYQTTRLPQQGPIGALALAELGRCAEAADWQRKMIALAEQKQQTDLAAKLKADLKLYEARVSCRPSGQ
jgi:hypothetical protein